jgi:hypothetical protein
MQWQQMWRAAPALSTTNGVHYWARESGRGKAGQDAEGSSASVPRIGAN